MKKKMVGIFSLLFTSLTVLGSTTFAEPKALVLPQGGNVRSLGNKVDPASRKLVEGYAIVHYKQVKEKDGQAAAGGAKGGRTQCYGYFASEAKWKASEPWLVNPSNLSGLDSSYVANTLSAGISKWEDATDGRLGNGSVVDILGNGSITTNSLSADSTSPDGQNEVYFGAISDVDTIAVTVVWGIFSGPTTQRQIVEWDQVYDDTDYNWSANGETAKMDFDNIATHELGHSIGLADMYNPACSEETMFGYSANGETKKRSLNTADIAGTNKLY